MELFFDLVFVFAVTQLSHYLLEHHTALGALQTAVMFLAMWWARIYTAWATNWLDPGRTQIRLLLVFVMLLSLVLSSAIPGAFGPYGIISLGEGLLVTGATFADLQPSLPAVLAFLSAFIASVAMWWIYFDVGARRGSELIEHEQHAGLIGRTAYT